MNRDKSEHHIDIAKMFVDKAINDDTRDLIALLREHNINDGITMLTILGLLARPEYFKVLHNRLKNNEDKITESYVKKEVSNILKEIDKVIDEENEYKKED